MARRKSRRAIKKPPKKQLKLDTVFKCPFCSHPNSVECTIDRKEWMGSVSCWFCQADYYTTITALTEPIDIYHEWFDECVRVNNSGDDAPRSA